MKKPLRIALAVGVWAAVTWLFRDKLLRIARPESGPVPAIRTTPAGRPRQTTTTAPARPAGNGDGKADDLTEIKGIGPVYQGRLADAGITTFAGLAAANAAQVADAIDAAESMIDDWIDQARQIEP